MQRIFLILFILCFSDLGLTAPAPKGKKSVSSPTKIYKNSYVQFEMPSRWQCELKFKAYLCRYRISKVCKTQPQQKGCKEEVQRSREAVIVIAAKPKTEVDTLATYLDFLGEPLKFKKNGRTTQSRLIHNKVVDIQKQKWVDAMHLGSEIPQYYTRYLATVRQEVAVLITFTAHKKYYTKYSTPFFKGIKSLHVTASQVSKVDKKELGDRIFSRPIDIPDELFDENPQPPSSEDPLSSLLFGLAVIVMAVGVYIWLKRKKLF